MESEVNMTKKELLEILNNLTEEQLQVPIICEIGFTGYWGVVEHKIADENMYYDSEFNDCLTGESVLLEEEENFNDFELIIKKGDSYLEVK